MRARIENNVTVEMYLTVKAMSHKLHRPPKAHSETHPRRMIKMTCITALGITENAYEPQELK